MKLISMTDFVLKNKITFDKQGAVTLADYCHKINNYANFLKQPLTLGIFVPCDEKGKYIEKPSQENYIDLENGKHSDEWENWKKAKQNVLFHDFILVQEWFRMEHNPNTPRRNTRQLSDVFDKGLTIENIIGVFHDVELTESAQKQIGL